MSQKKTKEKKLSIKESLSKLDEIKTDIEKFIHFTSLRDSMEELKEEVCKHEKADDELREFIKNTGKLPQTEEYLKLLKKHITSSLFGILFTSDTKEAIQNEDHIVLTNLSSVVKQWHKIDRSKVAFHQAAAAFFQVYA